jgi:multidrug resistance efflux pump
VVCVDVSPQRKTKKKPATAPPTELTKLREEFVKATSEYKASLTKLLTIYEGNVKKAEEKLELSRKLLAEGLISRLQVEENERALAADKAKVEETRRQMTSADEQVANIFAESEAEKQLAKDLRLARQSLVRTASFTRYTGH